MPVQRARWVIVISLIVMSGQRRGVTDQKAHDQARWHLARTLF